MPSRQTATDVEGFGMVFLEAGFFAKPSVGTRTGGIPEAVIDGETGVLVPQDDVNALRDALSLLLKDKPLARRLGEKARERVLSEFSWEKATSRFLTMFS
jgi:phosphatidylinositol alpha-1,6-mannosyltransferase